MPCRPATPVKTPKIKNMELRKVIKLNSILAVTLPKAYANSMGIEKGDYAEVFMANPETLIIKRHSIKALKLTRAEVAQVAAMQK